jgi:GNAT superfamily N-acetyltransferase
MIQLVLMPASVEDAKAIAALHTDSWRSAYRGLLPDDFLDGPVFEDRRTLWSERMRAPDPERRFVCKAVGEDGLLLGFACVLLDAEPEWGALLDNLHVRPDLKATGIGYALFTAARDWVRRVAPGANMHLTVLEGNERARRFYERQGGTIIAKQQVQVLPGVYRPVLRYGWKP